MITRRMIEKEKEAKLARISVGFGDQFGLGQGLVVGSDESSATDPGAIGLVIPWGGCKHIKVKMGAE